MSLIKDSKQSVILPSPPHVEVMSMITKDLEEKAEVAIISFKELNHLPHLFFNLLPYEWKETLVPYWPQYTSSATILGTYVNQRLVGGGIIFKQPTLETVNYPMAETYFNFGCPYIGYLWVSEPFRHLGLGSAWLDEVAQRHQKTGTWLSIEENQLLDFYQRNGYQLDHHLVNADTEEWILGRS